MLAIMVRKDQPLSQLAQVYLPVPEIHRKVALNGRPAPSQDALNGLRDEAEAALDGAKRIVLRPSGTEPVVRVMVQHEALRDAESMADTLAEKIAAL